MTATLSEFFGNGTAIFALEGNISCQPSAGVNPGATAADNVLAVFSIPANSFDQAGRGIAISAAGGFGATTNNKRVKIIIGAVSAVVGSTIGSGGTTIADTGTVATNGGGWQLQASVFKYGAAGSNTQAAVHNQAQMGSATAALLAPSALTLAENLPILVAVTGNATTATTDIALGVLEVNATN
jgi:hypothetical protein